MLNNIFTINQKRSFNLQQVHDLLPVIYRLTDDAHLEVKNLLNQKKALRGINEDRVLEIDRGIETIINTWEKKVQRLGAVPKGLWLADFDKGDGYYCWKFPETKISYWHGYDEGFTGRKEIFEN